MCFLQETHLNFKYKHGLQVKVRKMIVQANGARREVNVAVFTSDKIDFNIKYVTKDKDGYYIIKGDNSPRNNTLIDMHPTWEHQNI